MMQLGGDCSFSTDFWTNQSALAENSLKQTES